MKQIDRRAFVGTLPILAALPWSSGAQPRPALLPFIELDHISVRVSDVRASARFYMRLFGSEAARDQNRQANPASRAGELWFVRLGRSHLAFAPLSGDEAPGVDHYCLSVSAFAKDAAKARLAGFDQPYPDWPSNNVWLKDPDGMLIQLAPSANEPQVATIVRNAVAVPRSPDLPATPPFQAVRISKLVLASRRTASSADYYHKLLGDPRSSESLVTFGVGPSRLILAQEGTQSFGVAVASFDLPSARSILSSIGLVSEVASDRSTIVLRDPDGIPLTIAGV